MAIREYSAGAMRHTIEVQSQTSATDAGGGRVRTFTTFATLKAHVRQQKETNKFEQGVRQARGDFVFTTRFISGVSTDHRIKYDNRFFVIKAVGHMDERKKYQEISAKEGVAV